MSNISSLYGNPNSNYNIITKEDDYYASIGQSRPKTTGKSEMGMSDFLQLLAAQMSNQDMMNPVSDTEFIAQMAQFSSLTAMQNLTEYTLSAYAVSYTGKHVIISGYNDITGKIETISGQVERVTFMSGAPKVVVNGMEYDLHTVMEISDIEIKPPNDTVKSVTSKYVAIEALNPANGQLQMVFGIVSKVVHMDGRHQVLVNGKYYDYESIRKVSDDPLTLDNWQTTGTFPLIDPDRPSSGNENSATEPEGPPTEDSPVDV